MNKVYICIYKNVLIILGICTIYCLGMSVFGKLDVHDYEPCILFIGILVYIGIICTLCQKNKRLTDKNLNYIKIFMLVGYLILTLIFGLRIKSERPADIFNLHNAAISYLHTGKIDDIDYFSNYPYQLNYTYVLIMVYKIGSLLGINDYRTSGTLFGVILLFFSAVLVYKIAEKIKDKYLGVTALFVFVTNPVFWIYSSYYYTDLMGMVLILLIIDIALCINENKNRKCNLILSFLLGFIFFTGYQLRATVAIGGIAILMLGIVRVSKIKEKVNVYYIVCMVAGFALAIFTYKIIDNYFGIELDKNKQFPVVHWIMMGLSEERSGRWSGELWNYTNSFPTYGEKTTADIEAIKQSLSDMGVIGVIRLLFSKLVIMWTDGMTALTTNFRTSVHYGNLYEYTIGNKNAITCYCTQIMRSSLLFCIIPYLLYELKNKFSKKSILAITFFGYMIFYFFWEVHEKYALMFLPLLVVMAVYGISILLEMLSKWQKVIIEYTGGGYSLGRIRVFCLVKRVYLGLCVFTLVLYVLNWNDMVVKTNRRYNYIVYQSSTTDSINVGNDIIKQTFWANSDFNAIYVRFLNSDVPKDQEYSFSLYDDSGTCIYQERFTANDIDNDTYHAFNFESIQVNEHHEFYFEIAANVQYEETIKICSAGKNYTDYYARGRCMELQEYKGDLTFRVYYIKTESYYSKLFYIMMTMIVLLMEIAVYRSINVDKKELEDL